MPSTARRLSERSSQCAGSRCLRKALPISPLKPVTSITCFFVFAMWLLVGCPHDKDAATDGQAAWASACSCRRRRLAYRRRCVWEVEEKRMGSDILRVISRSQTDVQPVFDAIVDSAIRVLGA